MRILSERPGAHRFARACIVAFRETLGCSSSAMHSHRGRLRQDVIAFLTDTGEVRGLPGRLQGAERSHADECDLAA